MQRMSRLLLVASAILPLIGFAPAASAQGQVYRSQQKIQEKATEANPNAQVQAVKPGGTLGGSGLNVKGRFNCKCNSGKGSCAVVKKADTIECKPGVLNGCTSCSFATSTEELAPQ